MDVEVFDAGKGRAQRDVKAEGEDEDAHHPASEVGGQDLDVTGLYETPQTFHEWVGDGFAFPVPFFEQTQWFSEVRGGDWRHLDGVHRWRVVILAAASTVASISASLASRWV